MPSNFSSVPRIKERGLRKDVEGRKGEIDAINKDITFTRRRNNLPADPKERAEMENSASKVRALRKKLLRLLKQRKQNEQRKESHEMDKIRGGST